MRQLFAEMAVDESIFLAIRYLQLATVRPSMGTLIKELKNAGYVTVVSKLNGCNLVLGLYHEQLDSRHRL